ncbi:nonsense-mediated mRNA decay protein 2-like [Cynara cardunculus var. scolymus]|uniref:nonsense-mediated mRNA decay protein 2-like n=1 Tax=Cynara cardunculus var. scolymus TaxID=59895 RepID=UPI000D62C23E|nr:nonsense-mediated mRNA decay protein 2-like [Cynara cardunculus var. scolymus]
MADFEQRLDLTTKILNNLTSRSTDDKVGEKDLPQVAVVVPTTPVDVDAHDERVEANEANVEVIDTITSHEAEATEVVDAITSREAEAVEAENNDDAFRADAQDEDLPITSVDNVGDKEDEDDDDGDEVDDPLSIPDARKDLGGENDDEDDDDDDFTIKYHTKLAAAKKGVSLRESSSQEEKEKKTSTKNQNTSFKDKGVVEEGNLIVLFKPINPQGYTQPSWFALITSLSQLSSTIPSTTRGRLDEWVPQNPISGAPSDLQMTKLKESLDQTRVKIPRRISIYGEFDFLIEAES